MSAVYCSRTASCWVVMQLDGSIRCIIRFKAKMHQCNQVNVRIAARSTKEQHITALLREASLEWHIKKNVQFPVRGIVWTFSFINVARLQCLLFLPSSFSTQLEKSATSQHLLRVYSAWSTSNFRYIIWWVNYCAPAISQDTPSLPQTFADL